MQAQVKNGDAASNDSLLHLESVARLSKIPIVESAVGVATGLYGKVKESHSVLGFIMNKAEDAITSILKSVGFILVVVAYFLKFDTLIIEFVDTLLCIVINVIEKKDPAVKSPSKKMPAQVNNGDAAWNDSLSDSKIPIKECTCDDLALIYKKIKELHSLLGFIMNQAEVAFKFALKPVRFILVMVANFLHLVRRPIKLVDTLLSKGLDIVEEMVPARKLPPQKVILKTGSSVSEGSNSDEKAKQLCQRQEKGTSPPPQPLSPAVRAVVVTNDRGSSTAEDQVQRWSSAESLERVIKESPGVVKS